MFRKLLFLSSLALVSNSSVAPASQKCLVSQCSKQKTIAIKIMPTKARTKYDYSKSFTDLSRVSLKSKNPYGVDAISHTFGIASTEFQGKSRVAFSILTDPNTQQSCVWYDKIDVQINIDPTILIANEYKKGGCHFKEVMMHEQEHVSVDIKIINEYSQRLGGKLYKALQGERARGPFPQNQLKSVQAQMDKKVQGIIAANYKSMSAERDRRQAKVDSKENYDAISHKIHTVCDKKSPMTAKRVRKKL